MFRAFTRPIYQVSVYRTIGPLVLYLQDKYYSIRKPSIYIIRAAAGSEDVRVSLMHYFPISLVFVDFGCS